MVIYDFSWLCLFHVNFDVQKREKMDTREILNGDCLKPKS